MNSFCLKIAKKIAAVLLTLGMVSGAFSGCKAEPEVVNLSLWCAPDDIPMITEMVEEFKEQHKSEAVINVTISEEDEPNCRKTVLANPQAAADVYTFPADQFRALYKGGALLEITENADTIITDNGGMNAGVIKSATADGKLCAYPATASNGYFLYYNSKYLTEEDVKSFDRILEVAAANDKIVCMDFSSGWYIYSFFKGAGLDVGINDEGTANHCNWNSTDGKYKGTDVAEAMLKIATHKGFRSLGDNDFVEGAKNGTIIAGVSGTWKSTDVEKAFGDGYAAAKLPEFTIKGDSVQMSSFAGYKLLGVNAYTQNPEWSMKLAEWLTNEQNQMERFRQRGEGPSNINAASSPEIQNSPAMAAFAEQSVYGELQNVLDTFWNPTYVFGTIIAAGNPDDLDIQTLLDTMTAEITAPPAENNSQA